MELKKNPPRLKTALFRYLTVGVLASSTQFTILILLVEMADADPTIASGIGFFIATLINYILQHSWTFQSDQKHSEAFLRYSAVTSMTMCINLLLFWTLNNVLHLWYIFSQITTTCTIAMLNFILNRHFTFNSAFVISDFRKEFTFDKRGHATKLLQISTSLSVAIAIRFIYLLINSTVVVKNPNALASTWTYWLTEMGMRYQTASLATSFLPGILLTIPVIIIARALYDERIAWVSSFFTILHPRLVEFSCNGSTEMVPLFLLCLGIALWTLAYTRGYPLLCLFFAGISFGLIGRESIESIIAFLCCLILELILPLTSEKFPHPSLRFSLSILGFILSFFLVRSFQENSLFYGLGLHWNLTQAIELFPAIILSPLFVFAAILPIFAARSHIHTVAEIPLIVMLIVPIFFYLIHPSIQNLLPIIIPIHIFGSAGLIAFCTWISHNILKTTIVKSRYLVIPIIAVFLVATIWIAIEERSGFGYL